MYKHKSRTRSVKPQEKIEQAPRNKLTEITESILSPKGHDFASRSSFQS